MDDLERQVHEIFTSALLRPPAEWPGYIDAATTDAAVRARVRTLLEHHTKSGGFLARPAAETFPDLAGLPQRLAEFRILREIGRGGMGVVYLAEDEVLKRPVALKVLPPASGDPAGPERFRREAQAVARLAHPGIVQVFRTGEDGDRSYIAMEFVDGENLRARLGQRPKVPDAAALRELTRIVSEIADALDHAHRQGVIHRDVKPSNILLAKDGRARLSDFGVARIVTEQTISSPGDLAGSYPYMSPEQARLRSVDIDHRTDIFSLGVVLYELLTGRRPFDGATPQDIVRALSELEPTRIRALNPKVPADLETICLKALEKSPGDRYQTAAHLAADLRCFLSGAPILARPPTLARRLVRLAQRRRRLAATVAFAVVLLGASLLLWRQRQAWVEAHAALSVHADGAPALHAFLARPNGPGFSPPQPLGDLPLRRLLLPPGPCRLLVAADDQSFAEYDLVLRAGVAVELDARVTPMNAAPPGMLRFGDSPSAASFKDPLTGVRTTGSIALDPFLIDDAPVTNAQYRAFLQARGGEDPAFWRSFPDFASIADRPVVDLTRDEMEAYARWAGKRLPTFYEWVLAAQAPDGRRRPWGDGPPPESAAPSVQALIASHDSEPAHLADHYLAFVRPVRSPQLLTGPSRLQGTFGNIREMTATTVAFEGGAVAVLVGSDWASPPEYCDLGLAIHFPLAAHTPQLGFRCAKSVAPRLPPR